MAEGTPAELKQAIGRDLIVAEVEGNTWQARPLLEGAATVIGIGVLSMSTALLALRGRTRPSG